MKKRIIVNIHGSLLLDKAVRAIFKQAVNEEFPKFVDRDSIAKFKPFIYFDGSGSLMHAFEGEAWDDDGYRPEPIYKIDAATEMGKLIELLEAPQEIIIKAVTFAAAGLKYEYDGIISDGGMILAVGCQQAHFAKVKEVYEAMIAAQK